MPCSRSARSPSVSSARSSVPLPSRAWETAAMCSSWSERIDLASNSSRPISVDLPSSTEPAVASRSVPTVSEVAGNLAVLHGGLGGSVVGAGLAALGDAGRGDLLHDRLERRRARGDGARAAHVADRAVADPLVERLVALEPLDPLRVGQQHPVAAEHQALVREVDRGHLEPLAADVLPDVELGPVREREHAQVLARADARVVEVPQLGPLAPRVPAAEVVAERDHALLGPRTLLVAARAAQAGVEAVRLDRVEQRRGLQAVARGARPALLDDPPAVDRLLHGGDDQPLAQLGDSAVAEL